MTGRLTRIDPHGNRCARQSTEVSAEIMFHTACAQVEAATGSGMRYSTAESVSYCEVCRRADACVQGRRTKCAIR